MFSPDEEIDEELLVHTDASHGHPPKVFVSMIVTKPTVLNPDEVANGMKPIFDKVKDGKVFLGRHVAEKCRKNRRRDPVTKEFIPLDQDVGVRVPYMNAVRYAETYTVEGGYADAIC